MRHVLTAAALGAMSYAAAAAEVATSSKVDAVTVFLQGAEVTRIGKAKIDKGEHTVVFTDLPAGAVPGSIRVDGKATGKLDIGSVDTRRTFIARADGGAVDADRRKLEDELERMRDQKTALEAQVKGAETQRALIANLANLPVRPAPAAGAGALGEDWAGILALIASASQDAGRLDIEAQIKIRDLDQRIEDADNKLSSLAPEKAEQTEVKVNVEAGSPLDADFVIRYQVANASWAPLYDARLQTGSKTAPPKLDLARRASITQRSGETWDSVALQLSTARPSAGASAPDLVTQTIDYEPEMKPVAAAPPPMRSMPVAKLQRNMAAAEDGDGLGAGAADLPSAAPEAIPMEDKRALLTSAPFEATYGVPGRVSVAGTGEANRVVLVTEQTEPVLTARTVPKLDPKAYLYARLSLAKSTPLLPGQVYLFRDGTFVGTSYIPLLAAGEEHELGFGGDDQVKVRYAVIEEKRGETGLISTSRTDSRNFRATVKNMHERAVQLVVLDQIPVSLNQDIKVEYLGSARPSKQNVDDKRGLMSFDAKLEPDEEKVFDYGYRVSWPAAKSIIYGQ